MITDWLRKHLLRRPCTTASGSIRSVTTDLGTFECFAGDHVETQLRTWGAHQRSDLAVLLNLLLPNDRVFDIGAHIGTYAVPVARALEGLGGHLTAFEPTESAFRLLVRNLEAHGLNTTTEAHQQLFSDRSAPYAADVDPQHTSGACYMPCTKGRTGNMYSGTLDEWLLHHPDHLPTLIKIDVEGMEELVLKGGLLHLEKHKPVIVFEVSPGQMMRHGSSPGSIAKLLRRFGYTFFLNLHPRNGTTDTFDLVHADNWDQLLEGDCLFDLVAINREDRHLPVAESCASGRKLVRNPQGGFASAMDDS